MKTVKAEIYPFNKQSKKMFESVGFKNKDKNTYIYKINNNILINMV